MILLMIHMIIFVLADYFLALHYEPGLIEGKFLIGEFVVGEEESLVALGVC